MPSMWHFEGRGNGETYAQNDGRGQQQEYLKHSKDEKITLGLARKTEMPAQSLLEGAEELPRHQAEMRFFDIPVLDIVRDPIRKDVLDLHVRNAKAAPLQQLAAFPSCICVRYRAARLRF